MQTIEPQASYHRELPNKYFNVMNEQNQKPKMKFISEKSNFGINILMLL